MKSVEELYVPAGGRGIPVRRGRPGANMLVLKRAITWEGETWTAGVDRVHVSHPAVARHPHLFEATDATDERTRSAHRALLTNARRLRTRPSGAPRTSPQTRRPTWWLPPS